MKGGTRLIRHSSLLFSVIIAAVTLLSSCGARSGYFKIEGRFLHINQGDLYVYSPDGAIEGMDTIHIKAGRFAYETPMQKSATLIMVFGQNLYMFMGIPLASGIAYALALIMALWLLIYNARTRYNSEK